MRIYVWLGCIALAVGLAVGFWPKSNSPKAPHPISDAPARHPAALPLQPQAKKADVTQAVPSIATTIPTPVHQDLWPENQWSKQLSEEGFPLYRNQADLGQIRMLDKGMVIMLPLPNREGLVKARITETKAGIGGIPVLTGAIGDDSEGTESITVVRGKLDTHMTIITQRATWTAVVDNKTGETIVVDERDRMKTQVLDINDGVEADHPPLPEPPVSPPQ
jgi:hypothetical protein